APQQARYPRRPALDQDDAQPGVFLKNPMRDEADQVGLDRLRPEDMRLAVRAHAAAAGAGRICSAAGATVDRDRTAGLFRGSADGLEYRTPETAVEGVVDEHRLDHALVGGVATDLLRRDVRQLAAEHDG